MDEVTLGIYVMSYKRSDRILTQSLLEDCTYVVRKSEEEAYRNAGVIKIWAVPDELINTAIKTYWYIIDNAPEDIVFVADDDIEAMQYRLDDMATIDKESLCAEIERIAQMLYDLDLGYACIDATGIPYGYDGEFAFKGSSGSIKWVNKAAFKARPDHGVMYNYDADLVLQELLRNRVILKPRYIVSVDQKDVTKGGESGKKRQDQIDSIERMKIKWGKYFSYSLRRNIPTLHVDR